MSASPAAAAALATITTTYGPQLNVATGSLLALTTVCVLLRFYARLGILKTFGADDWLLHVAQAVYAVLCSQAIWNAVVAERDTSLLNKLPAFGSTIISIPFAYLVCQVFVKLALAAFFHRIITQTWQRMIIILTVGYFCLYTTAFAFVLLFQCGRPTWEKGLQDTLFNDPAGICIAQTHITRLTWISVISNCVTDWVLVISPIYAVLHLKLRPAAKAAACGLLVLGVLGSVVSVIRIPLTVTAEDSQVTGNDRINASKSIVVASIIEPGLAIIALSLAALRPLMKQIFGAFTSRAESSTIGVQEVHVSAPPPPKNTHHSESSKIDQMPETEATPPFDDDDDDNKEKSPV